GNVGDNSPSTTTTTTTSTDGCMSLRVAWLRQTSPIVVVVSWYENDYHSLFPCAPPASFCVTNSIL
ncbi:unnamed protein product, partial [Ceratitis capitata]